MEAGRAAVVIEHDVPAAMHDGAVLRADVVRPTGGGLHPVLLCRTPYGKQDALVTPFLDAIAFARHGYIVVVQDVRGRGTSDGDWEPFVNEMADGHDSVLWAAALAGSNGKVGMFGSSYLGFTQWAAAASGAAPLRAIVPALTWADPDDGLVRRGGVWEMGATAYLHHYGFATTAAAHDIDALAAGRSRDELADAARRVPAPLAPPDGVASPAALSIVWASPDPAATVPALNIAGWYDLLLAGTLDHFVRSRRATAGSPARGSRLIVGPWSHINFTGTSGAYDFGRRADFESLDATSTMADLIRAWFDRWLRPATANVGTRHPWLAGPPVRLFVMGENAWRTSPGWPPPGRQQPRRWRLHPGGLLSSRATDSGAATPLLADPHRPAPTLGGAIHMHPSHGSGVVDHSQLGARSDVATFNSAPLGEAIDVIGPVSVELHLTSSHPTVDVVARLVDVHPDGFARNLTDGIVRLDDIGPHRPRACTVDLWSTANRFSPGHRIQVQIATASWPRWASVTASQAGPVALTVHHGPEHPSALLLPGATRSGV